MAAKIRIDFHYDAFNALRNSQGVVTEITRRAHAIAAAAGEGHEVEVRTGGARARASVRTATYQAMRAEAVDKTLTSSLDAGRG